MANAEKVGVLAVMQELVGLARRQVPFMPPEGTFDFDHQQAYEEAGGFYMQVVAARAAVAELIEADQHYNHIHNERPAAYESNCMSNEESHALHEWRILFDKAEARRAAALANVQPASTQGES